ncbi:MAG: RNA-binding transcriptional accessory protein [Planctomycetes bacterium]|nr:RNA-binding transcriptional accessory protein [Planctomycetota bacterium]
MTAARRPGYDPRVSEAAALAPAVARELALPPRGVAAALALFADGATVPFVARYRKEATGGLDEVQLRSLQERHAALVELERRRAAVLAAIEEQGQLTPDLRARLAGCATRAELEDLYLPFKKKRRTRASQARERGLEPLARRLRAQPDGGDPAREAAAFVDAARGVPTPADALAGARDIVAEEVAEDPACRALVRDVMAREGLLVAAPRRRKKTAGGATDDAARGKFADYEAYRELVARAPSHRVLAVLRGEREEALTVKVTVDEERLLPGLLARAGHRPRSPFGSELAAAVEDGLGRLLLPGVETDVRAALKERADRDAVAVFGQNLRHKLLAAPLGPRPVVGVDPGLRTGCKLAAVDASGAFRGEAVVHLARGGPALEQAGRDLVAFVRRHLGAALDDPAPVPAAVAVGNGTAGREAEAFAREALARAGLSRVPVVSVDEAGASVYSASDLARRELPDLDVTVRGAVSIARRLQDPLAELVKLDPRSIGVGQYQHDVDPRLLEQALADVVESCVNQVGVELNTASAALLGHVAGIGPKLAERVVAHRERAGPFRARADLLLVAGLGPRTFEQCAGFLRVRGGRHPLDASAVHPERYALVERMARDQGVELAALVGDAARARAIPLARYASAEVGEPTLRDILAELEKPGRDPRDRFEPPRFRDDVRAPEDLRPGMALEGVVTNVVAFGAFVDVGVHQDGLVHVSELADRFVRDPAEVVHVGQRLQVRVLSVDLARRRIALSARSPGPRGPG